MTAPADLEYWAAKSDSKEAVSGLITRIRRYRETLRATGRADRMRRNWMAYQGWGPRMDADASRIKAGGQSAELLQLTVNHFAAMVNQAVVLTTSNKLALQAVAANGDYQSLATAQLAEALNDYYDRELSVSDREYEATLGMVLMSEAWLVLDWDATAGRAVMADDSGRPVHEGDVTVLSLTPFDVAVDPDAQDAASYNWVAFRKRVSKYDLAARFPKMKDKILAAKHEDLTFDAVEGQTSNLNLRRRRSSEPESDQVYVWELRHVRTPACPNGRRIVFLDEDCVLQDSVQRLENGQVADYGFPFGTELYAYTAAPERIPGTPDGHTSFFDLLSLQEGVDLSASIIASAINSGGLQNLYVPRGANVTATKLTGALNVVEYDGDQVPHAQENVAINPVVGQWADKCVEWMRQRVSLNDVVMGEPTKGMPAQAMALLRAQAVEFHSRLQASYERLVQRCRTGIIKLLAKYARVERVALVAGKANTWALKRFKASDLEQFDRFVMEPVSPIMKTLAGKVGFAQPLLESGAISIQEYFTLVTTGRLEPILRFDQDNYARIQREKEMLMNGIGLPPPVIGPDGMPMSNPDGSPMFADDGAPHIRPLITDTHWLDIPEALGVLAMPEVRDNPQVTSAVLDLVKYRLSLWRQMDPAIIMLLKGVPPPPPGMMPLPPGVPPGVGPAIDAQPMAPGQPPGAPPVLLPKPPPNPITGEQDLPQ